LEGNISGFREEAASLIEVKNLSHAYPMPHGGIKEALRGVSFSLKKGEFLVVLGHNGSGKSTLAKHLNALLQPSGGAVLVDGLDTRNNHQTWNIRQKVGMVFQNPDNQLIASSVEEDVAFGPENLGLPPDLIRRRVDEALESVKMSAFKSRGVHLLSGGQKQRIAIAGIVAMRPEVLVLDEATAMLDPQGRREVMETLIHLNQDEGLAVIHITHIMEEAVFADRVIVMEEGHIVMEGTPRQVFSQVDTIKGYGLDVPPMMELAHELRGEGISLPQDIMTLEEMVNALCP
jgi:energy-coupling factor transport system ATP-binding protein